MRTIAGFLFLCLCFSFFSLSSSVIVTPFTGCSNCTVTQYLFPSLTEYVFLMADGSVYKSIDEGLNWTRIGGEITHMYQYFSSPQTIILRHLNYTAYYVTTNGGANFTRYEFPVIPLSPYIYDGFVINPHNPGWIAIFPEAGNTQGYWTKDYGLTWSLFGSPIHFRGDAQWCIRPNASDIFFALVETNGTFGRNFSYTTNYGVTWNALVTGFAHNFTQTWHFLFASTWEVNTTTLQLWANSVYDDALHTNSAHYRLVQFSFDLTLNATNFQILDDVGNSELISVSHNSTSEWGTLFNSWFSGAWYTVSLPRLQLVDNTTYDLALLSSMPGVYIANQHFYNETRTVVSSNSGGSWWPIFSPDSDIDGNPFNCSLFTNNCSLNLHATTQTNGTQIFPGIYSVPSAVGIVLATGNPGTYLTPNPRNTSTFVSRDGGLIWHQLWNDTMISGIGNHGGIIVFGHPYHREESYIHYSLDHGHTQQYVIITPPNNNSIAITQIIPTPFGESTKLVVLASDIAGNGYIYQLDFSDELNVTCNNDTDYEYWSPTDFAHGNASCINGATTVWLRRKSNVTCYDNITDHFVSLTSCPCNFQDYECDYGFWPSRRNFTNGFTCTPINATQFPPCWSGYRLVPNTMCDLSTGLNLLNLGRNCSWGTTVSSTTFTTGGTTGPATVSTSTTTTAAAATSTGTTGPVPGSTTSTTGEPVTTTTTGGHHKKGNNAGLAVGLTFMFLFLGGAATAGVLYWRHDRFHAWVDSKIGRGDSSVSAPILRR